MDRGHHAHALGSLLKWNALGGIVWAFGYGLLAYFFGKALVDAISTYGLVAGVVIGLVVVAAFVGFRYWRHRRARAARRLSVDASDSGNPPPPAPMP